MNFTNMIKIGDILTCPKNGGLITHYGVVIGTNRVLQNTPGRGEHTVDIQSFSCGKSVKVRRHQADAQTVVTRASAILANPKSYDVFTNNCEHTVTKIINGTPESPQLALWLGLAALAGLVFMAARR